MKATDKDPDRPDGPEERMVRIETRLVAYQSENAQQSARLLEILQAIQKDLAEVLDVLDEIAEGNAG